MNKIKKNIALFLLSAISLFIVPKELVHSFYGHSDTEHVAHEHCNSPSGISIEEEHTHCEILSLNVPLYVFQIDFIELTGETAITTYAWLDYSFSKKALFNLSLLRAPPVSFS